MNSDSEEQIYRDAIAMSIEKALLEFGEPVLDKVSTRLKQDYKASLADCYENPDYLIRILKELFGEVQEEISQNIRINLEKFSADSKMNDFLMRLDNAN